MSQTWMLETHPLFKLLDNGLVWPSFLHWMSKWNPLLSRGQENLELQVLRWMWPWRRYSFWPPNGQCQSFEEMLANSCAAQTAWISNSCMQQARKLSIAILMQVRWTIWMHWMHSWSRWSCQRQHLISKRGLNFPGAHLKVNQYWERIIR